MNRRNAAMAMALVALGVVAGVVGPRYFGSSTAAPTDAPSSDVIDHAWVAESGYIVVTLASHAEPDHLLIHDESRVLAAEPVHGSEGTVILPPTREMRIKLEPLEGDGNAVSYPGASVPDDHPETDVVALRPGDYNITAMEGGERADSTRVTVPPEAVKNYVADRPLVNRSSA